MPEFDQSLYWKLVPYFRVPMETVHVILVVSGPSCTGLPNVRQFCHSPLGNPGRLTPWKMV